ncbi:MAG: large conductance mechanosensitive channel protein MscL [Ferruginibacter sp.]
MGFIKEFRDFAVKGNLVDIAVAFVMGAAFSKVITSFTEGIISPLVGLLGGADLSKQVYELKPAITDSTGKVIQQAVALKWGDFVTAIINFIIVAFVVFLVIKAINRMKRPEPVAEVVASTTDNLLAEIRDELRKR